MSAILNIGKNILQPVPTAALCAATQRLINSASRNSKIYNKTTKCNLSVIEKKAREVALKERDAKLAHYGKRTFLFGPHILNPTQKKA